MTAAVCTRRVQICLDSWDSTVDFGSDLNKEKASKLFAACAMLQDHLDVNNHHLKPDSEQADSLKSGEKNLHWNREKPSQDHC